MSRAAVASVVWICAVAGPALAQVRALPSRLDDARAAAMEARHADVLALLDATHPSLSAAPPEVLAEVWLLRAQAHRALSNRRGAEAAASRALAAAARAGAMALEADVHLVRVDLAMDRGDVTQAADAVARAEVLAAGDRGRLASVLYQKGRVTRAQGRVGDAVALYARALELAESAAGPSVRIQVLGARSTAYLALGDYDHGLADAQRAYDLARATRQDRLIAAATFALAQATGNIRDLERSAELWGEAIDAYRRAGPEIGVSLATRQRMDVWFALGDLDRAAADGDAALAMFERTGSAGTRASLLARLALIAAQRGRAAEAGERGRRAERALGPDAPAAQRMTVTMDLGLVALEAGRLELARKRFTRTEALASELADPDYAWRAAYGLGRVELARKAYADADRQFARAIALIERQRRALPDAGLRAAFLSDRLGPYDGRIEALMAQADSPGDPHAVEALLVAESGRARALADLLADARLRVNTPAFAAVRRREREFAQRFVALQQQLGSANLSDRAAAAAALTDAEREFEAFQVATRRESPALGALAHPSPFVTGDLATAIGPDESLVAYWLGAERGAAWLLRDGRVTGFVLPGRRTVEPLVRLLTAAVAARDPAATASAAAELGAVLLGPMQDGLRENRALVVVPDGALARVPFALLRLPGDDAPVVTRWATAISPSIALMRDLETRRRPGSSGAVPAVIVGNGGTPAAPEMLRALFGEAALDIAPLTEAAREARSVARLIGADAPHVFLDAQAHERAVKGALDAPARVIHIAAHALVDDAVPRRSALLLAGGPDEDGLLQMNEIGALSLDADLVMLSACRTHLGRQVRGEGLVSLARTFMLAGASAVGASLWAVEDGATRALMERMYAHLSDGAPPREALRQAQLELIADGGAAALPVNWAGFLLTGRTDAPIFTPRAGRPGQLAALLAGLGASWWIARRLDRRRHGARRNVVSGDDTAA